ncbi:unnamed protein product [Linum trigynum]|uniref:Uncharacterized protein n=1 Tax=Linum trigynum TaxID=586398 RepID=A0AAV2ENN2_9ROSI
MFGMEDGGRQTADDMDGWTCCKGGGDIPCVFSSSDEQPTRRVGGDPTATLPDVSDCEGLRPGSKVDGSGRKTDDFRREGWFTAAI